MTERHLKSSHGDASNMATALSEYNKPQPYAISLEQEGVEPTNNIAERVLRTGDAIKENLLR